MKKIIITIIIFAITILSQAQSDTLRLSIQQAVETGLINRFDVKANLYNKKVAENKVKESRKQWVPEITGGGQLLYNSQMEQTVIPAGLLGNKEAESVSLTTKYNSSYTLSLNQSVYNPSLSVETKISKNELAMEDEKDRAMKLDVKNQIKQAYLNVLLKDLQKKTAKIEQNRYKEYCQLDEGQYKYGKIIENDYLRVKLDFENSKVKTKELMQNYCLAVEYLKYIMNTDAGTKIVLTDSLKTLISGSQSNIESGFDIENRTEVKQLLLQSANDRLQIKDARRINLPNISVFANYSQEFQNDDFKLTDDASWYPVSYIGVKLNLPISSHYRNKNIKKYQYLEQQTKIQMEQTKTDINYEIEESKTKLDNAVENMKSTHYNYELSEQIYQNQKQQYHLGGFSYDNLLDTEKTLNTAEQNYIKATYDYLVARVNYEKALGN